MKYKTTLGGRQFVLDSNMPLTQEQVNSYTAQKLHGGGGGCPSCASAKTAGGIPKLGTITCGGPYVQNTPHTLAGSVISGGTAPFTYTWVITPPSGNPVTLTGEAQTYTFAQVGVYTIDMDILDSCLLGGRTNRTSCSVTVIAPCVDPLGHINID